MFANFRESGGSIENIFLNFWTIFDLSIILEVKNKFSSEIFEKIGFPTFWENDVSKNLKLKPGNEM